MGASIKISGNIGRDPELRFIRSNNSSNDENRAVCSFSVYQSNERKVASGDYEDKGGFWVDVNVWGRDAEHQAKILKKGHAVTVTGNYYIDVWVDQDGGNRITHRVDADRNGVTMQLYKLTGVTVREAAQSAPGAVQGGSATSGVAATTPPAAPAPAPAPAPPEAGGFDRDPFEGV